MIKRSYFLASTALGAAAFFGVLTSEANANPVTVTLTSVTGEWVSVAPIAPGGVAVTGVGTNQIRWGTGNPQSGYGFVGAAPPTSPAFNVNQVFTAGTFTHLNFPIAAGTSITGAELVVNFMGTIQNGAVTPFDLTSTFDFIHNETPNAAAPCADGGSVGSGVNINGCADLVIFSNNPNATESVNIEGTEYVLNLTGFVIGGGPADEFWTAERLANDAIIQGVLTQQSTVIPVPAALPIILAALGGFGIAGYRQRKAA